MLNSTPAHIIASHLISRGYFTDPTLKTTWPLFISFMPDVDGVENNCASIYDTTGTPEIRTVTNDEIIHYGLQLKVRSTSHSVGFLKLDAVREYMKTVYRTSISVDGGTYQVQTLSRFSPIMFLGLEQGTKRRMMFTVNFFLTLR